MAGRAGALGEEGQSLAPICKVIPLWPEGSTQTGAVAGPDGDIAIQSAVIDVIDFEDPLRTEDPRPTIIVAPGGGYRRHPETPARGVLGRYLHQQGFLVLGLRYRNHMPQMPGPLADGVQAVRLVRAMARDLGAIPSCIALLGFSSGAHVSAGATVFANATGPTAHDLGFQESPQSCESGIANALITACAACCLTVPMLAPALGPEPVLTFETGGRGEALFGTDAAKSRAKWSPDLHVPASPPPLFAFHSALDDTAPVENSQRLVSAWRAVGGQADLMLVDYGGHADFPAEARDAMVDFLKKIFHQSS